jgi:hypothetical protein
MAFKLAEAYVELSPRGESTMNRTLDGIHRRLTAITAIQIGSAIGTVLRTASQAFGQIVQVGRQALGEFIEQEQQVARLNAVLKATGHAARFTGKELQMVAADLQDFTTFGDEAIMGTQAVLASFRNIRADVFLDATEAVLDLSAGMRQDLRSSALQLGKALQDPIQGVTALRRVGVALTKQQEDQIKKFMELGKVQEAQRVILNELKHEFGGVAVAMGQGPVGELLRVRNQLGDEREKLGEAFLPLELSWTRMLRDLMPLLTKITGWLADTLGPVLEFAGENFGVFWEAIKHGAIGAFTFIKDQFLALKDFLTGWAVDLTNVFRAYVDVIKALFTFQDPDAAFEAAMQRLRAGQNQRRDFGLSLEAAGQFGMSGLLFGKIFQDAFSDEARHARELAEAQGDPAKKAALYRLRGRDPGTFDMNMSAREAVRQAYRYHGIDAFGGAVQTGMSANEERRHNELVQKQEEVRVEIQANGRFIVEGLKNSGWAVGE